MMLFLLFFITILNVFFCQRLVPLNLHTASKPFDGEIVNISKASDEGDIYHIEIKHSGNFPYVEGQSLGIIPFGEDSDGKPHKQRMYSIASDSDDEHVSLCVRKVFKPDINGNAIPGTEGICSTYICTREIGDKVQMTGPFGKAMLMPEDDETHLIMVATGTGVAPFRGFLRNRQRKKVSINSSLYLGGRDLSQMPYKHYLEDLAKSDKTFDLEFCLSRPENPSIPKEYVQHRITNEADKILSQMEKGSHLYLCGLKGMKDPIMEALKNSIESRGGDFKKMLAQWKKEKRIHIEVY